MEVLRMESLDDDIASLFAADMDQLDYRPCKQEDDFLEHLSFFALPSDGKGRKQQQRAKPKAASKAYRNRSKDQISQLEKQQQLMLQKLEELTLQNHQLRDRSTVLKDIVQCLDEIEAVRSQIRTVPPEAQQNTSLVEKLALWNERVQQLTRTIFEVEIGTSGAVQALEAAVMEFDVHLINEGVCMDDPEEVATFLALHLHQALPLLKVSEEQHWATVAASLQLSPQQRSHALIAREVFLSASCKQHCGSLTSSTSPPNPLAPPDLSASSMPPSFPPFCTNTQSPTQSPIQLPHLANSCPDTYPHMQGSAVPSSQATPNFTPSLQSYSPPLPTTSNPNSSSSSLSDYTTNTVQTLQLLQSLPHNFPQQSSSHNPTQHPLHTPQPHPNPTPGLLHSLQSPSPPNPPPPSQQATLNRVCQPEHVMTAESLARLEQKLSLFSRRMRTMFHYINTRLLTPLQAARAHVHAYPMFANPIALLNAIAMFSEQKT